MKFNWLLKTIRREGVLALYKGFLPSYIRLGPWNILVWYFKEYFYFVNYILIKLLIKFKSFF